MLPARLEKELQADGQGRGPEKKQRGSMFAISRRKVARKKERKLRKQGKHRPAAGGDSGASKAEPKNMTKTTLKRVTAAEDQVPTAADHLPNFWLETSTSVSDLTMNVR